MSQVYWACIQCHRIEFDYADMKKCEKHTGIQIRSTID